MTSWRDFVMLLVWPALPCGCETYQLMEDLANVATASQH